MDSRVVLVIYTVSEVIVIADSVTKGIDLEVEGLLIRVTSAKRLILLFDREEQMSKLPREVFLGFIIVNNCIRLIFFELRVKTQAFLDKVKSILSGELKDCCSDLQIDFDVFLHANRFINKYESSKFRILITNCQMDVASTLFIRVIKDIKRRMMPTHTDIGDSNTAL